MVSTDHFRHGLLTQMARAAGGGHIDVLINCGQLYRSLGGYLPKPMTSGLLAKGRFGKKGASTYRVLTRAIEAVPRGIAAH